MRQGNGFMYYDNFVMRLSMGFALRDLHYRFDYRVRGMDWDFLSMDGWLEGGTTRFGIFLTFKADMRTMFLEMEDFYVEDVG